MTALQCSEKVIAPRMWDLREKNVLIVEVNELKGKDTHKKEMLINDSWSKDSC